MSLDANQMDPTIRNLFLSTATGFVSSYTSPWVLMRGNAVTYSTIVTNISASSTFDIYLDGSFDAVAPKQIGTYAQNSFGYNSSTQTAVAYTYVRIRLNLAGTNVSSLSSHSLSFADL